MPYKLLKDESDPELDHHPGCDQVSAVWAVRIQRAGRMVLGLQWGEAVWEGLREGGWVMERRNAYSYLK